MTPAESDEFFLRVTTYFDDKVDALSTKVAKLSTEVRQLSAVSNLGRDGRRRSIKGGRRLRD